MGMFRLITRITALGMCVWLAGCASSKPCDDMSERCNAERLLYQNDMLQARMLIASGVPENFVVANALLDRAAAQDRRGEVPFYKALLKIKAGAPSDEVIGLLEQASEAEQPYATALLYKIYSEPYLIAHRDPAKAAHYRIAYGKLDVAISGYPSFEKALALVDGLLAAPPELDSQAAGR